MDKLRGEDILHLSDMVLKKILSDLTDLLCVLSPVQDTGDVEVEHAIHLLMLLAIYVGYRHDLYLVHLGMELLLAPLTHRLDT